MVGRSVSAFEAATVAAAKAAESKQTAAVEGIGAKLESTTAELRAKIADEIEVTVAALGSKLESTAAELTESIGQAEALMDERLCGEVVGLSAGMAVAVAAGRAAAAHSNAVLAGQAATLVAKLDDGVAAGARALAAAESSLHDAVEAGTAGVEARVARFESRVQSLHWELTTRVEAQGEQLDVAMVELDSKLDNTALELRAKIADEVEVTVAALGSKLDSMATELTASVGQAEGRCTEQLKLEVSDLAALFTARLASSRAAFNESAASLGARLDRTTMELGGAVELAATVRDLRNLMRRALSHFVLNHVFMNKPNCGSFRRPASESMTSKQGSTECTGS